MNWITDRTYAFIHLLKNNVSESTVYTDPETGKEYTYTDIVDRGTLSVSTLLRWQSNIEEMSVELLKARVLSNLSNISLNTDPDIIYKRIVCTYPGQPINCTASLVKVDKYQNSYTYANTTIQDNQVYQFIKWFNDLINISGIDTSKYNIPVNTEYLHYVQLNDLEAAVQEAYSKLTTPQIIYSGNYISNQFNI